MASLRKRYSADGERFVWVVDFRLHGKRHVKSTRTDDRAIARQALKDIEARIVGGRFGLDERDLHTDTLSSFAQDFLAYSKANKAHKTFRTDQDVFARFIEFLGGDVPLEDITQETVERFKIHRTQQGLKPNSVNVAVRHLKAAFNVAVKWGKAEKNPFRGVAMMKPPQRPPNFLSHEQVAQLLEVIADPAFKLLVQFVLLTGLRRGEVLRLQWRDVDQKRGLVRVMGKGQKTRTIPIGEELSKLLSEIPHTSEQVFPSTTGGPRAYEWVGKKFKAYATAAGLDATLHTLRHTFASHLVMAGVDLPTVQHLLGHAHISTTMIYSHLSTDHIRTMLDRVTYW